MGRRHKKRNRRSGRHHRRAINAAENAVVWVCERWLAQGKIICYLHSFQSGQMDKFGVDILISLRGGLMVPVQITLKASNEQVEEKRGRHFRLHPHVKSFLVVENNPQGNVARDEKIYRKIAQDLAEEINKIVSPADKIDPDIGEP